MSKVFCFGELLLRMSPQLQHQWIQKSSMPVYIGGAELNVATALAKWNILVKYCTALPDHYLSHEIVQALKEKNIDTSPILFSGNRIGTYYLPQGADLKNAGVIYDRAHSSFSELKTGVIDWKKILQDCSWFHFSAISPALNENIAVVCKEAIGVATSMGLTVSVDLNYRSKLWQYGKNPPVIMRELMKYCNVVMGNIWSVENLLGIESPLKESKYKTKEELLDAAGKSMKQIHLAYENVTTMAYTFRLEEIYYAVMQHGKEMVVSKEFPVTEKTDQAGSGDCFMGGLIYGFYNNYTERQIIDFAAAAAVGKLKERGDATNQTIDDVKRIMNTIWAETKI